MKKALIILLALCVMGGFPWTAAGEDAPFETETLGDGTLMITHCHVWEAEVTIPDEISGRKVTGIADHAFGTNLDIRS